jgi:hypothetical protein
LVVADQQELVSLMQTLTLMPTSGEPLLDTVPSIAVWPEAVGLGVGVGNVGTDVGEGVGVGGCVGGAVDAAGRTAPVAAPAGAAAKTAAAMPEVARTTELNAAISLRRRGVILPSRGTEQAEYRRRNAER